MDSQKKSRKSNFSETQLRTLVSMYAENKQLLLSKQSSTVTNDKKAAVWQKIADAVNATSNVRRTVENCRKKWFDVKAKAIKFANDRKRPKTGGGPPPEEPWFVTYVLDIIGEESALIDGIEGNNFEKHVSFLFIYFFFLLPSFLKFLLIKLNSNFIVLNNLLSVIIDLKDHLCACCKFTLKLEYDCTKYYEFSFILLALNTSFA